MEILNLLSQHTPSLGQPAQSHRHIPSDMLTNLLLLSSTAKSSSRSTPQLLLPDKPRKHRTPSNQPNAHPKRRPRSFTIAVSHNIFQVRLKTPEVRHSSSDAFRDLGSICITSEGPFQRLAQRLVEGCRTHGDAEDRPQGAEEVAACCSDGLVRVGRV
jgi:hypothetical protein